MLVQNNPEPCHIVMNKNNTIQYYSILQYYSLPFVVNDDNILSTIQAIKNIKGTTQVIFNTFLPDLSRRNVLLNKQLIQYLMHPTLKPSYTLQWHFRNHLKYLEFLQYQEEDEAHK